MDITRREFVELLGVSTIGISVIGLPKITVPTVLTGEHEFPAARTYGSFIRTSYNIADPLHRPADDFIVDRFVDDFHKIQKLARPLAPDMTTLQVIVRPLGSAGTIDPIDFYSTVGFKVLCVPSYIYTPISNDEVHTALLKGLRNATHIQRP